MSLISVIVPVYKVEQYINRCVDSILNQTFTDFELILVDDGSPDNCGKICDEYAEKDKRVVVIHQENGGLSAARNAGIDWAFANSDSQWITFIDSDDWVHLKYIETLYNIAVIYNCSVSACEINMSSSNSTNVNVHCEKNECLLIEPAYSNRSLHMISACCKLYKKELLFDVRYPLNKIHEDRFTTYKILFKCEKIAVCYEELYYYQINELGITHSEWTIKRMDDVEAVREQFLFFRNHNYRIAYKKTAFDFFNIYCEFMSVVMMEPERYRNQIVELNNTISQFVLNDKYYWNRKYISIDDLNDVAFCVERTHYLNINNKEIVKLKCKLQRMILLEKRKLQITYNNNKHLLKIAYPFIYSVVKKIKKKIASNTVN